VAEGTRALLDSAPGHDLFNWLEFSYELTIFIVNLLVQYLVASSAELATQVGAPPNWDQVLPPGLRIDVMPEITFVNWFRTHFIPFSM
jgi:hypothetical protein